MSSVADATIAKTSIVSEPSTDKRKFTMLDWSTSLFSEATPELESNAISTTALAPYLPP